MNPLSDAIAISLGVLTAILLVLTVRGVRKFATTRSMVQLAWTGGLGLAAAAMAIEAVVYVGVVNAPILRAYVFLSAAIVGVLSLGATRVLRSPRVERVYAGYTGALLVVVGLASFLTPLPTAGMVTGGVITGNPPLLLILLSTFLTGPATVVLIVSAVVSLRRTWRWPTLLMVAGAFVLGAGGTLYIASFPVALYYAEFIGIVLLFFGLISLPRVEATPAAVPADARA